MSQCKHWFTAAELAGLPEMPRDARNIRLRADREQWKRRKRSQGKGWEYFLGDLPLATQTEAQKRSNADPSTLPKPVPPIASHTHPTPAYDQQSLWALFEKKSQAEKDRAGNRLAAILNALHLIESGIPSVAAWAAAASTKGFHVSTLYTWYNGRQGRPGMREYKREDWLAALAPGYIGRTKTADCSVEAWDFFKADYLRPEAPAAQACYERLQRAAVKHGWAIPSVRTLQRRVKKEFSAQAIVLARKGAEAIKHAYPAQERDRSVFHALEAVNADGHKFDGFVKWPDGEIGRPMMVAWQDLYSGKILSYRVDKTENTDSVRLSFGDVVEQHGIPSHAYLDNGRGFASKWMTGGIPNRYRFKVKEEEPEGILTSLGCKVHWATPYHGQAKPIERAFRDMCEYIAKHPAFSGAYTGNKPDAQPENYGSKSIPIETFLAILEQEINAHNAREGRRSHVCNGRSFDAAFAESYEISTVRKATEPQRRLWLLAAEGISADRRTGAIRLGVDRRNRYWCDELARYAGQKLVVRFDPQRLHESVHVYTLDGRYIAEAQCLTAAGFNDSQAAREHNRARTQFKKAARQQLDAARRMKIQEVAALLPGVVAPEPPVSSVVRMYQAPTIYNEKSDATPDDDEYQGNISASILAMGDRKRAESLDAVDDDAELKIDLGGFYKG